MDSEAFFTVPSVKAALIIGSVIILVFLAFCIMDKSCCYCLGSTKFGNYEYNMEHLEHGQSEEKETSVPISDSNGLLYEKCQKIM